MNYDSIFYKIKLLKSIITIPEILFLTFDVTHKIFHIAHFLYMDICTFNTEQVLTLHKRIK